VTATTWGKKKAKPFLPAAHEINTVRRIRSELPQFNRYFEGFVDSGALFFALRPRDATLFDSDPALINAYRALKKDPDTVMKWLRSYGTTPEVRARLAAKQPDEGTSEERAADYIFLHN
jgi:DNA adenine methylase